MEISIKDDGCDETLVTFGRPTLGNSTMGRSSLDKDASFEINRKKRRISAAGYGPNDTGVSDGSTQSLAAGTTLAAQSPWETRRMKVDLIEARTRITVLKKEIEHQNTEMATMSLRNQHKISSLEQELAHVTEKATDLEKHLTTMRKREHKAKEELVKTRNQFNLLKQTADDQQFELHQTIRMLEERSECEVSELNSEIRDLNTQVKDLREQLTLVQDELDTTREINDTLQSKADAYDDTKRQLDETRQRLEMAESRVKALEFEVGSYEDWKNLSRVTTGQLASVSKLERENQRLKDELKNIQDLIGNKLLLEEQVSNMKTRLEYYEQKEVQMAEVEVRLKEVEQELTEWRQLGKDYGPQGSVRPAAMRNLIVEIMKKEVVLTSEQSTVQKQKDQIQNRTTDLQSQNEVLEKNLGELKRSLKYHQSVLHRVQKKLQLVIGERDCLKQLLDSYEKDLTINQNNSSQSNQDVQMRVRMEMLEKSLAGYQELCKKLEAEIQSSKSLPDMALASALTSEQYENLRKEIDELRLQNTTLLRRKNELELEVQNLTLRRADPTCAGRVLRMNGGPVADMQTELDAKMKQLQAEVERLRARNRKLEEHNGELSECLSSTAGATGSSAPGGGNVQQQSEAVLRGQLQLLENKYQTSREIAQEFREVCNMLFGYRVDRINGKNYRLSSQYAESPGDYLNFQLNEDSSMLIMLETEYGATLHELVKTQLKMHGSLPAFLSSLTLELFNRTTAMVHIQQ